MLCQVTTLAELLRIEKINLAVIESLLVEFVILNHGKLRVIYLVGVKPKSIARLLIEFGRITQPDKYRVRLCRIIAISAIDSLNQCRQHYCLARARR